MGMRQLGAMDMDMALLDTGRQGREDLARIEQALGVEGAFHAMLLLQIGGAELLGHQVSLFHANAMLARQHATHLDAKAQYGGAKSFRLFEFAVLHGVKADQGM